jgi:hypothetical protein
MPNRKESEMSNPQRETAGLIVRITSAAVLSVAVAAVAAPSAFAQGKPAPQSVVDKGFPISPSQKSAAAKRNPRYFGYAGPERVFIPGKGVINDGCDLPSTGCPSYLSN